MNTTLIRKTLFMCWRLSPPSLRFLKPGCVLLSSPPTRIYMNLFCSNGDTIDSTPQTLDTSPQTLDTSFYSLNSTKEQKDDDVSTEDLKLMIGKYFKGDEEVLPSLFEAILRRKRLGNHEESDEELMEKLRLEPLDDVGDDEFDSAFDEAHETDEEIQNLYNVKGIAMKRMMKDENFNMTFEKWSEIIKKGTEKGILRDTTESAHIAENLKEWGDILPDELKNKVLMKMSEVAEKQERGELEPGEAEYILKKFEDEMVREYGEKVDEKREVSGNDSDDPPGEGPILRWQTRVVFSPGGDAWHPKNRKVKMSVTVKELGLSKYQFLRLKEIVGKRYKPGNDELTITSERFEHREENRKDCLRTLYALVEEAEKADKLVDDARVAFVKQRLLSNPAFMDRLLAKKAALKSDPHRLLHPAV